jgi:hypothetical protein
MNGMNTNMLLVLAGLLLLILNLVISVRRKSKPANLLNILLAMAACILAALGLIGFAFNEGINLPAVVAGQAPPFSLPQVASIVGLVVLIAGYWLYRRQRDEDTFDPSASTGLLHMGAAIFVLVAALVIPILPVQFSGGLRAAAAALTPTNGPAPTRIILQTSTPTATVAPTETATPLPTLTPTLTETPIIVATPIKYQSADIATPTACTVTAQMMLNLRSEPSAKQRAIGRVFAGRLLKVLGRSENKQWWKVINDDGKTAVEGWVSAQYVTPDSACTDEAVPVIKGS